MAKIRISTYREVANPDGKIKLPQEVVINLPANKLSRNEREWTDVSNGVAASNRAIERGVPVLYMYLGHPCWDDPIVTGMMPVARLTNLVENSDTSVDFYAQMEYGSDQLPNKTSLFVGGAIAAGVDVDCSIRAAAEWKWGGDGIDQLEIPEGDYPLVIDFLPPDQQPGIVGTKVSQVTKWESAAKKIKQSFTESNVFRELIDDLIKQIKFQIEKAGANATGRKDTNMPTKVAKKEDQTSDLMTILDQTPDEELRPMIKGLLLGMNLEDSEDTLEGMDAMDSEPKEDDFAGEGTEGTNQEAFKKSKLIWEAKQKIMPLVEASLKAHPLPKDKPATTTPAPLPKKENKETKTSEPTMSEEQKRREAIRERLVDEAIAREEAGNRSKVISEASQKAITGKTKFYGHEIWDQDRYPQVLVDKAIQEASEACQTERELALVLPEKLDKVVAAAKLEAFNKRHLPGKQYVEQTEYQGTGGWKGEEQDEIAKIAEEKVVKPFERYLKENHPKKYDQFQSAKAKEDRKAAVERTRKTFVNAYREDFIANGSDQNANYAALMTGIGMVRQWIPSPIMQLAQNGPRLNMAMGRVSAGGGGMPMGQYVEITSSSSTPPRDYDLAERQLATDGLRQVQVFSQPHQYFARWREIEIVWNKDTLYWLGQDPWRRDLNMEGVFHLFQNLNKQTELMISAENLRGNMAYGATAITNESVNFAQANHFVVFGNGDDRIVDGKTISNAIGYFKLRRGQSSGTVTLALGPVVPPGINPFIERNTESLVNAHPVTLAAISGKTQSRGKYDRNLQMGVKINESDPEPTYLVLDHVGIVVMLEGSRFDGSATTTVSQYTPVSNYTRFDCTLGGSETNQIKANQLAELILLMMADLRRLRQVDIEEIDYLLGSSLILEGLLPLASHFQGQNKLDFANIGPGMQANNQYLEILRRCLVYGTTDPTYDDNRLLTLGMSKTIVHAEYAPPMLGDLLTCGKVNSDGKLVRTHQQAQSLVTRELIATIPPARDPETDEPKNFGVANIYIVNPPASSGLPA